MSEFKQSFCFTAAGLGTILKKFNSSFEQHIFIIWHTDSKKHLVLSQDIGHLMHSLYLHR
jgi:hypothetical protein